MSTSLRMSTILAQFETRSRECETICSGMSLAVETDARAGGESRLKAGCSQDWLPHKTLFGNAQQSLVTGKRTYLDLQR